MQEVIMLQEKVANVAHGWLLKEEASSSGGSQLKHYWFVLFSNGILMYFSDPNRAVLGQSLGFIPVESCGANGRGGEEGGGGRGVGRSGEGREEWGEECRREEGMADGSKSVFRFRSCISSSSRVED